MVDKMGYLLYNIFCVGQQWSVMQDDDIPYCGVWLSLARAPGLGPGSRRFESCHPDAVSRKVHIYYAGVVQW